MYLVLILQTSVLGNFLGDEWCVLGRVTLLLGDLLGPITLLLVQRKSNHYVQKIIQSFVDPQTPTDDGNPITQDSSQLQTKLVFVTWDENRNQICRDLDNSS